MNTIKVLALGHLFAALSLLLLAGPSWALTITSVLAPDLFRPSNGLLYSFTITVNGTYSLGDIILGVEQNFSLDYWDDDGVLIPDDPIRFAANLAVPAPPGGAPVGTPWTSTATLSAGCTMGGTVFGLAGTTGENPMDDGYFDFPGLGVAYGYNTVTCEGFSSGETAEQPLELVPEPSTALLLGLGLVGLAARRRV